MVSEIQRVIDQHHADMNRLEEKIDKGHVGLEDKIEKGHEVLRVAIGELHDEFTSVMNGKDGKMGLRAQVRWQWKMLFGLAALMLFGGGAGIASSPLLKELLLRFIGI